MADRPTPSEPWAPALPPILIQPGPLPKERPIPVPSPYRYEPSDDVGALYVRQRNLEALGGNRRALEAVDWDRTETRSNEKTGLEETLGIDERAGMAMLLDARAPLEEPQEPTEEDQAGAELLPPEIMAGAVEPSERGQGELIDAGMGILHGAARAGEEFWSMTDDAMGAVGLPEMSGVIRWLSQQAGEPLMVPEPTTTPGQIVSGVTHPIVAVGASAVALPARAFAALGGFLRWTATGAVADFAFFSPKDPGLAGMAQDLGQLDDKTLERARQIFVEALAKEKDDTWVEGRLKNIGEGLIVGATFDGLMALYRGARKYPWQDFFRDETGALPTDNPVRSALNAKKRKSHRLAVEKQARGDRKTGMYKNAGDPWQAPDLPAWPRGAPTTDQWVARVEHFLTPEEIAEARRWYTDIYKQFEKYVGEDRAGDLMISWLIANQNVTPSGALFNALRATEKFRSQIDTGLDSGITEHQLATYLGGDDPDAGIGIKIIDFVDSAIDKDTRSAFGGDPIMGPPAVIDVQSLRDMGYTDPALQRGLQRLGYPVEDMTLDFKSTTVSPSPPQYERAASHLKALTNELNERGWLGGDLKPSEVQAIGWTAVGRITGMAESPAEALAKNLRNLAFELDFGEASPLAKAVGDDWNALPDADKVELTKRFGDEVMEIVNKELGLTPLEGMPIHARGGWMEGSGTVETVANVNAKMLASHEGIEMAANMIGYLMNQTEVMGYTAKAMTKNPKGFAVELVEEGKTEFLKDDPSVRTLWKAIKAADDDDIFGGFSPFRSIDGRHGISIVVEGGQKTRRQVEAFLQSKMDDIAADTPYNFRTDVAEARVVRARNDWGDNPDGQAYLRRLQEIGGDRPVERSVHHWGELEPEIKRTVKKRLKDRAKEAKDRPKGVIRKFLEEEEGGGPSLFPWLEPDAAAPFFSQALRIVKNAQMKKGTPQQWLAALKKGAVKDEELNWIGLPEFLEDKKTVTQDEVYHFVRENQVEVQESLKGPPGAGRRGEVITQLEESLGRLQRELSLALRLTEREARDFAQDVASGRVPINEYSDDPNLYALMEEVRDDFLYGADIPYTPAIEGDSAVTAQLREAETQHEGYQLPGGENYRELVFTWPESPETFRVSAHWAEDNPIAHMRFNERVDEGGRKMLFIEEVQSDWHQAGRKIGYKAKKFDPVSARLPERIVVQQTRDGDWAVFDTVFPERPISRQVFDTEAAARTYYWEQFQAEGAPSRGVPDAPFKKTWQNMVMKRAIRWAAENDFDTIGWTTGRQQAQRWSQLQTIDEIRVDRRDGEIQSVDVSGRFGQVLDPEIEQQIRADYSDLIDDMMEGTEDIEDNWIYIHLGGEGPEFGGENMKAFYDRILPNTVNKFTKKWGVKAQMVDIEADDIEPVWSIEITPEMKKTAMEEGFPLFSVGGAGVGALAASQMAGEASKDDTPGEFRVASLARLLKPLLGKAGREAMERPPPPKVPPAPAGVEEILGVYDPYRVDLGDYTLPEVEGLDFNMKNLDSTAEAKDIINQVSKAYEDKISAKVGGVEGRVVPHEVTRQVADLLGTDEEAAARAIRTLPGDVKNLHIRALTMRDMLVSSAEAVDRLAFEIAKDPTAVTNQQRIVFYEQIRRHAALQANMKGVQTEIARALSSFRIPAGANDPARAQMVQEAIQAAGGDHKVDELAKLWLQTPVKDRAQLAADGPLAKTVAALREMWINGLLSGPRTHTVNFVSNQLFMLWQVPERVVAGGIGATRRAITGSKEGVRSAEAVGMLLGLAEGFPDALRLGWTTFKTGEPSSGLSKIEHVQHQNISAARWGMDEKSLPGRFVDLVGTGVRIPGRLLITADEFQKGIGRSMERRALAYRLSQEDLAKGASTQDAARTYLDVVEGKGAAEAQIDDFADTITFTRKLGEAGQSIQRAASRVPAAWLLAPFIRTPTNIMKQFGQRTPLAWIGPEVRADLLAGGARADLALAKISTGTAAMAWAAHLAAQGDITGGGPSDWRMRQTWLQEHQPYSVKIGDKWYPYGRIEPLGMLFGVAADLAEFMMWAPRDIADQAAPTLYGQAVGAMLHRVGNRTFFTGLSEFAKAFEDPDRYAESYIRRMAGSFMPFSSLVRDIESAMDPARSDTRPDPYETDPFVRNFQGTLNEWKARAPGLNDDLPPRLNHWGEEVVAYEGHWVNAFNVFASRKDKAQPIDDELLRLRYPISMPRREIQGVKLDTWQYHNLVTTMNDIRAPHPTDPVRMMNMREYMSWLVGSPAYLTQLSDEHKIDTIKSVRRGFLDAAKTLMLTPGTPQFDSKLFSYVIESGIVEPLGVPFQP